MIDMATVATDATHSDQFGNGQTAHVTCDKFATLFTIRSFGDGGVWRLFTPTTTDLIRHPVVLKFFEQPLTDLLERGNAGYGRFVLEEAVSGDNLEVVKEPVLQDGLGYVGMVRGDNGDDTLLEQAHADYRCLKPFFHAEQHDLISQSAKLLL